MADLTFATVRTRILAAWNIATIAKPDVEDANTTKARLPNTIYVDIKSNNSIPNTLSKISNKTTFFDLETVAITKEDSDNYKSELEDVINYHEDGTGWWFISNSEEYNKDNKIFKYLNTAFKKELA